MQTRQEKLAEKVRQVRQQKGLSVRDVAAASKGGISPARVSDVENCRIKDIQIETLKGLAKGLGIPAKELTDIVFDKAEEGTEARRLVWYFSQLPIVQRGDMLSIAEALYEKYAHENPGGKPTQWSDEPVDQEGQIEMPDPATFIHGPHISSDDLVGDDIEEVNEKN